MSFIGTSEKKSEALVLKRHRNASWSRQAGQGTLEYILVLTVTVILILTVVWQFNDAFRSYAENFFDGYVACLLETGELPGRGGDCSAELKKFNVADGKPLINGPLGDGSGGGGGGGGSGGSGSGGNGSGGNGSGSAGRDGKGGANANAGNKGSGGGGDGGGGSGGGESGAPAGQSTVGSIGNRGKGRAKSTAVAGAKDAGADEGGAGKDSLIAPMAGMGRNGSDSASGRSKKTALDRGFGYWGQEQANEAAESKAPVSAVSPKNEAGENLRSKKSAVDTSRKVASVSSGDEEGFSLGYLLRIILIAGIIIAIVVFFGGQLMQISKSSEK